MGCDEGIFLTVTTKETSRMNSSSLPPMRVFHSSKKPERKHLGRKRPTNKNIHSHPTKTAEASSF